MKKILLAVSCILATTVARADYWSDIVGLCVQNSPATHPPCNKTNGAAMILDEVQRGCTLSGTEDVKCKKAAVDICLKYSPATHPPCNVANELPLILDEIKRSAPAVHACASDAIEKAKALLPFHFAIDDSGFEMAVDDDVKVLPPVKALTGKGKFDVLEVWGHIYKADYRMRFIYAQIKDDCVLMGQEIIEASNPY